MADGDALAILVGGGPAPGINGVISAATIEARNNGLRVIGCYEGFKHLMAGSTEHTTDLEIPKVSRIHFRGGSILRTSRANPTKNPEHLKTVVRTLKSLGVKHLVTIGGDDTAYSSSQVGAEANGDITVVHVPKTIDNDLPLPPSIPTFGYQTARSAGVEIVRNLMQDAETAPRWYIIVAMGRKAGHLALGIGKAAAAPLTLIPEEFGGDIRFSQICDIIEGAVHKRKAFGRNHGVAILAEGLIEQMSEDHIEEVFSHDDVVKDEHGHLRLDNLELGRAVRDELRRRMDARGVKQQFVNKNLGYELRCADPIPYDCEYTRDLGFGAVRFLLQGGNGAVITFAGGNIDPLRFEDMRDPATGRPRVRMVDMKGESYLVAREYMIRLEKEDADTPGRIEELAKAANCTPEQFKDQFGYLMK